MKKNSIELQDFTFRFVGTGHYKVTYTSQLTGKEWTQIITDMPLIDVTKNAENKPKKSDLLILKRLCKNGNF